MWAVNVGDGGEVGAALYRLGEIHRLRGEFTKAEASARATRARTKPSQDWRCFV